MFQDPGTLFQDPGTMFQDPGTMFDHYPFSPPAEFTKKVQNPKFHFWFLGKVQIWSNNSTYYPFSHRLNLQKNHKNPKFHFGVLEKVQIWTKNSTYYPFSPPAEFTKIPKSKVPLWIFRKGPNLDQKFDPLPLVATGWIYKRISKIQSSTLEF